ncbi:MAG: M23 family metallopeptidase [Desertifilum sp.]|nr:M23 family metallopeptidase [Desertifilum sp.]
MVRTITPYSPISEFSDISPGETPHPGGKGLINFDCRILSRSGEVLIDFGEFKDLISYRDTLSAEGASGSFTLKMRALLTNEELLSKIHPGCVIEVYCARNDDPIKGADRDPSKIPKGVTKLVSREIEIEVQVPGTSAPAAGTGQHSPGSLSSEFKKVDHIYTDYYIDDSPPGSYDFTLERGTSVRTEIPSPTSGKITDSREISGYGYTVTVTGDDGYTWFFAHLDQPAPPVGTQVSRGQPIGIQGTTGNSTGEHIHLEVGHPQYGRGNPYDRITDRGITKPMVDSYLDFMLGK